MITAVWHLVLGNDTPPQLVALARSIMGGLALGILGFLAMWSQTDEVKLLIIAGGQPFVTFILWRLGFEGIIDVRKNGGA